MKRTRPVYVGPCSLFNTLCRVFRKLAYVSLSRFRRTRRRLSTRRSGHTSFRLRSPHARSPRAGTARTLYVPPVPASDAPAPLPTPVLTPSCTLPSSISDLGGLTGMSCRTSGRRARRLFGTLAVPPYYLCKFNSAARAEKRAHRMMFSRIDNHCLVSAPIAGVEFCLPLVHVSAVYYKWF